MLEPLKESLPLCVAQSRGQERSLHLTELMVPLHRSELLLSAQGRNAPVRAVWSGRKAWLVFQSSQIDLPSFNRVEKKVVSFLQPGRSLVAAHNSFSTFSSGIKYNTKIIFSRSRGTLHGSRSLRLNISLLSPADARQPYFILLGVAKAVGSLRYHCFFVYSDLTTILHILLYE